MSKEYLLTDEELNAIKDEYYDYRAGTSNQEYVKAIAKAQLAKVLRLQAEQTPIIKDASEVTGIYDFCKGKDPVDMVRETREQIPGDVREALAAYLMNRDYDFGECSKQWGDEDAAMTMNYYRGIADKALAIIQPLIEAAEKRGADKERERIGSKFSLIQVGLDILNQIPGSGVENTSYLMMSVTAWQALKGGK